MSWVEQALPGLADLREREEESGRAAVRDRLYQIEQAYLILREAGTERPLAELGVGQMETAIGRAKGAWVLWMLRDRVGEPLFSEILARPEARSDLGRGVVEALTERAGEQASAWVDPFFEFWVRGTGLPDYRLVRATARARDGGYTVSLSVANEGTGAFPVPVVIQSEEGARHALPVSVPAGGAERIDYSLLTRPVAAAVDPDVSVLSGSTSRDRGWLTIRTRRWWIF
jgi:hypothetical protein